MMQTSQSNRSFSQGADSRRRFLGWDRPILHSAVDRLLVECSQSDHQIDLSGLAIVVPTSLAKSRLHELLGQRSQAEGKQLKPPRIFTVGSFPEQLYSAKRPFATESVQILAWGNALREGTEAELRNLAPSTSSSQSMAAWLEISRLLSRVHRELVSERLTVDQVKNVLAKGHPELSRWTSFASVQRRYLDQLEKLGLWDIQCARSTAIAKGECHCDRKMIFLGCVDLNRIQRTMVGMVRANTEIWIGAPEAYREKFDDVGCLIGEEWGSERIKIDGDDLLVTNTSEGQAELATATLAQLGSKYHAREVTIGVPDETLVPVLKRKFSHCGIKARYGPGMQLLASEPAQLLRLIGAFVEDRSYQNFALLIRHPATCNLLRGLRIDLPSNWLSSIDKYYSHAFPKAVDGNVNKKAPGNACYAQVSGAIHAWLKKLLRGPQKASSWVPALLEVLHAGYLNVEVDVRHEIEGPLYSAAEQTAAAVLAFRDLPKSLEPRVSLTEFIDWLMRSMEGAYVAEQHDDRAVELLGWLDLALDDAPGLVVTGMHDAVVPESLNADPFLPNRLRQRLGLVDNSRRYARDAYALQVMVHCRQFTRFIVGRNSPTGDPLLPSRLLLACPLAELPRRTLHLVQEQNTDVLPEVKPAVAMGVTSKLVIPRPLTAQVPEHMTVTGFREYLKCPYRFYLRHVLKLREEDDADLEMDAAAFGVLIHDTLEQLPTSGLERSTDAAAIQEFFSDELHRQANQRFGSNPPAAVLIQIEQAELRLDVFAEKQAQRASEGWEIRFTECAIEREDGLLIGNDQKLLLIGRIDRIDFHPDTGRWAIWDYKTSEHAKKPVSVHWSRSAGWQDLQLPLYRHLAKKLGIEGEIGLGYIAIPKQAEGCGFHQADFSTSQLLEADAVANEIASKVAAGEFWPEQIEDIDFDDFSRICQTRTQSIDSPANQRTVQTGFERDGLVTESIVRQAQKILDHPLERRGSVSLPPMLIRASAGTGKTFQLSNRLLQILLSGQAVDSILATTFTRKAAGEILARVLERLARACDEGKENAELQMHLQGVDASPANCLATLRRLTASLNRLQIGTLDSFFAQVARVFSFDMGLPTGWKSVEPVQERFLQMQAVEGMLERQDRAKLLTLVRLMDKGDTTRQIGRQVLSTVGGGYEIFRETDAEAWDQLPQLEKPSEAAIESSLLALSEERVEAVFKNKAARGQLERLRLSAAIGDWDKVLEHGLTQRVVDARVASQSASDVSYYRTQLPDEMEHAVFLLAERAAAEVQPIRRRQTLASYELLESFDEVYSEQIGKQRCLSFADVTHYLSKWFAQQDNAERLSGIESAHENDVQANSLLDHRLDGAIEHLLLDEFQDTAPNQWRILRPIAQPLAQIPRSDRSFFCVGDTKQAIYGWRGGVAEIFDTVTKDLRNIEQQSLQTSYRSSPVIMEAVNATFQHLHEHSNFAGCESAVRAWSKAFPTHETTRDSLPGYVCLQNGPKGERRESAKEQLEKTLSFAAGQIADLALQTSKSIGVLCRTNDAVGQMLGLLRSKGVTVSQNGGNPLTDSAAVELILSLLHFADHPGDGVCAYHLATSPLAAHLPHDARQEPEELATWIRTEISRRGLGGALESFAEHLVADLGWWDRRRLEQMIHVAYQLGATENLRLREFEEIIESLRVALPNEAQVVVMTIHASKGLEFDAVFLPDLEGELSSSSDPFVVRQSHPTAKPDGVLRYINVGLQAMLPESWRIAFNSQKEGKVIESLCLLYVAMTRARQALYIVTVPHSKATQKSGSVLHSTLARKDGNAPKCDLPENVLIEFGQKDWWAGESHEAQVSQKNSDRRLELTLRDDVASAPVRTLRLPLPVEPDDLNDKVEVAHAFVLSNRREQVYQRVISLFFASIEWIGKQSELDQEALRKLALSTLEADDLRQIHLEDVIEDFLCLLDLRSVREVLSVSRYKQSLGVSRDADLQVSLGYRVEGEFEGKIIARSVDRLVAVIEAGSVTRVELIVFCTDSFDPSVSLLWLDDRIATHSPTVSAMAKIAANQLGIAEAQVDIRIVLLSTDDSVRLASSGKPRLKRKLDEVSSRKAETKAV